MKTLSLTCLHLSPPSCDASTPESGAVADVGLQGRPVGSPAGQPGEAVQQLQLRRGCRDGDEAEVSLLRDTGQRVKRPSSPRPKR